MSKFRETYRSALDELPGISLDAQTVQDELRHRRMQKRMRKNLVARGSMAATVFILCGAGTVAAKNYVESVIRVSENGYTITKQQNLESSASFSKIGGVFTGEDVIPEDDVILLEPETAEYDSFDKFLAEGNVTVAPLDKVLQDRDFTCESILVIDGGRELHVNLSGEENSFSLFQLDYRGVESYSVAASYVGKSDNERNITNNQGLNYVVFDTLNEAGQTESVHAVISVNGREISITFRGFEKREIDEILKTLDLTIYFQD